MKFFARAYAPRYQIERHLMGVDQVDFPPAQPKESSATSVGFCTSDSILSVGWGKKRRPKFKSKKSIKSIPAILLRDIYTRK